MSEESIEAESLLAEVEELIVSRPEADKAHHPDPANFVWFGRVQAVLHAWDSIRSIGTEGHIAAIHSGRAMDGWQAYMALITLLHTAASDLRLRTIGPVNIAVGQGMTFDYFDALRKLIASATSEVLIVDRYLDAAFVSNYLPHVGAGVTVRLLSREAIPVLVPAATHFTQQTGINIQVRSHAAIHDRLLFVDGSQCYFSGASFKDGGRLSPTIISQVVDAFAAMKGHYDNLWSTAKVEM
jgi:hypothetical protein